MLAVVFHYVSKCYRIRQGVGLVRRLRPGGVKDFWAVKDVTFEVGRGETLGLIGHNGAGKSTILKLLSRITAPTTGEIRLSGRVAALIEVGSGFHPELTGRENVYLSGSLLGMRRREIQAKFDRIVEFAGVSEFIDMPVKWYSSGMYVRLGFAVAAHLEPDILLVDEVLAVGDAAFQLQCIDRLNELRRAGTTMLFISHDLMSIERLCDRVALMNHGQLVASGPPSAVVGTYQQMVATGHADAVVEVFYYSRDGRVLHCQQSTALTGGELDLPVGSGAVEFTMPWLGLQPGIYSVGATIRQRTAAEAIDWFYGRTMLYVEPGKSVRGHFSTPHDWRIVAGDGPEDHGAGV
jgi:ABC-type polysaccharide/polyol phosphate transport system ATPase subunit